LRGEIAGKSNFGNYEINNIDLFLEAFLSQHYFVNLMVGEFGSYKLNSSF
jgi:hypothetical protein